MTPKQSRHMDTLIEMKTFIESRNPHNHPLKGSFKTYRAYMIAAQRWQVERANITQLIMLAEERYSKSKLKQGELHGAT